jgi:C-terminal processing protease CtpA/Prc
MGRFAVLACLAVAVLSCTPPGSTTSAAPSSAGPTTDIKRTKLDIAYSSVTASDVHQVSSKKILQGAIDALKLEAKKTGGKDDFPTIEFQDASDTIVPDFRKFADAAAQFAARNPQITPDRFADVAIEGMIGQTPDCHTYYVDKNRGVHRSRQEPTSGTAAQVPTTGTLLGGPDQEAGLTGRLLPGGIVYITFREFAVTANYKIFDEVRKMMDKGLAAGGKAWLFDLRGNVGGFDADTLASFFLKGGESMLNVVYKSGPGGTTHATPNWSLPAQYQLPLVIVINDRGGSGPEVFAADMRETKRATLVGKKSVGCMGSTSITNMTDGSLLAVVTQEFVGAATGTKYNNAGVPVDVEADDATAVDKAIDLLKQKI